MFNDSNKNAGNLSRWLILGILGIMLLINRRFALSIAYILFAIGLMLAGAAGLYGWWKDRNTDRGDLVNPIGSVVLFIVGLWIMMNPSAFDKILNVIIGIVMIVAGANWLSQSGHPNPDRLMTILSIVAIVMGLIVTFSRAGTGWIATACGISLLYTAVTGFISEKVFRG